MYVLLNLKEHLDKMNIITGFSDVIEVWPPPQELHYLPNEKSFLQQDTGGSINWHSAESPTAGVHEFAAKDRLSIIHKVCTDKFYFWIGGEFSPQCQRRPYLDKHGYYLRISESGILAEANTAEGLFYALITATQILGKYPEIRACEIFDRPNCDNRGIMIDLARVVESPGFIVSLLPFLAECKLNQIYLYLENKLQFKSHPLLAHPCAWSHEEVIHLILRAAEFHIEIIPMPATIGHMESMLKHPAYQHLKAQNTDDHLDTDLPAAKEFIDSVIDEICTLFKSGYVHLSGDECPYLGADKPETVRKYAAFVNHMAERLRQHGRRGIIWGDMIEKYPELMQRLDKSLIPVVWKYGPMDDMLMPLPEEFVKAGFDTALAPAILADEPFLPTVERLTRNIPYLLRRTGMWGTINCMWEPRTQNLPVAKLGMAIAGAYSWMPFFQTDELMRRASLFTYGADISSLYGLLEGYDFFGFMIKSRFGYYHAFELTCNNPLIHLKRKEVEEWIALSDRLHQGGELLRKQDYLRHKYPVDYAAFEACAALAVTLADCVVLMHKAGQAVNRGADGENLKSLALELRGFSDFITLTLQLQRKAWNHCRRHDDENFKWWFEDPLQFKRKCIISMADEIEKSMSKDSISLADRQFFSFEFHKGDAPEWNLWRIKIFFSEDGHEWRQMFFRTIPLWMSDGLTLELMPESSLPQYVRIESCYAAWHRQSDWSDMLKIRIGEIIPACGSIYQDIPLVSAETEYKIEYSATCIELSKLR
jgi:hypothetical protein